MWQVVVPWSRNVVRLSFCDERALCTEYRVVNAHATRTNDSLIHNSAGSAFILHRPFIYMLLVCHFRSNHDFFAKLISLQLWVFPRISCMVGISTTPSRVLITFEDAERMKGNMDSVHTAGINDT